MGTKKRSTTCGRARDTNLHTDIRHGYRWKREHMHCDRQKQVYAHGHQLLSVQSCCVGPVVTAIRITTGNLPNMVQVTYLFGVPKGDGHILRLIYEIIRTFGI